MNCLGIEELTIGRDTEEARGAGAYRKPHGFWREGGAASLVFSEVTDTLQA